MGLEIHVNGNGVQWCVQRPCGSVDLDSSSILDKDHSWQTLQNQAHYARYKLCVYLIGSYDGGIGGRHWGRSQTQCSPSNKDLVFGTCQYLNPQPLFLLNLCCLVLHGRQVDYQTWLTGNTKYLEYSGKIKRLCRIICVIFGVDKMGIGTCNGAWHDQCYQQGAEYNFPVLVAWDLDNSIINNNLLEVNDVMQFKNTRNEDHMMVLFQCDICHFQNLKGRMPLMGSQRDKLLLLYLCWVILDSFWSRERSTVNSNRLEGIKFSRNQELLGLERKALPCQGLYPVEDSWGLNIACVLVIRSLNRGNFTN